MIVTRFVAKALVFDRDGNFLRLTRSSTHPYLAGMADLPGGTVEPGEEPGATIIREIHEETGFSVEFKDLEILYAVTAMINESSFPTLLYAVHLHDSEPAVTLSAEHDAYKWEAIEKLVEVEPQIAPTYRHALEYLKKNKILEF